MGESQTNAVLYYLKAGHEAKITMLSERYRSQFCNYDPYDDKPLGNYLWNVTLPASAQDISNYTSSNDLFTFDLKFKSNLSKT